MNFRTWSFAQRPSSFLMTLLLMGQALLAASCSLSTPYPGRSLYTINVAAPEATTHPSSQPPKPITLRIRRFVAISPFDSQTFVYRVAPNSISTDYYNTFAAPPADLITSQFIEWLRASHAFASITDGNGSAPHQWVMEGRLQDLSIDLSDSKQAVAVMSVQVVVMDESGAVTRVLADKTYSERVPIVARDAASAAAGWSSACGKIFGRIAGDLSSIPVKAAE
jgi:ABC-type uncharacterized transport system auxiliary subunit